MRVGHGFEDRLGPIAPVGDRRDEGEDGDPTAGVVEVLLGAQRVVEVVPQEGDDERKQHAGGQRDEADP